MKRSHLFAALPAVAASAILAAAGPAGAAECSSLPSPVYVGGSSASKPVLKQLAALLSAQATPVTLVYQSAGSCDGVNAIVGGTALTQAAVYWAAGIETPCDMTVKPNLDIGVSDVYAAVCPGAPDLGTSKKDFFGSVQVMTIVAPKASSENAISAEAARVVFGFGGATNAIAPWDSNSDLHNRSNSSGTKNMIARAIGLPVEKWQGVAESGSGAVLTAVSGAAAPNKALGILAADFADANRDKVKSLAFQPPQASASETACAYLPDSSSTSFDKINVRQGRYAIWGPLHFLANVSGGNPAPATGNTGNVKAVIDLVTHKGTDEATEKTIITAETNAFTVPQCAMQVSRTSEVGPMSSYQPDVPCGCFFESLKGTPSASCTVCTSNAQCSGATPTCRFGFCEAK